MKTYTLRKIGTRGLLIIKAKSLTALRDRFSADEWEDATGENPDKVVYDGDNLGDAG
ncbi:hypothetical protein ES705_10895 [subsurface metagenome]